MHADANLIYVPKRLQYRLRIILCLYRKQKVRNVVVESFPGNDIPIFRNNKKAQKQFEDAFDKCEVYKEEAIGYDAGTFNFNDKYFFYFSELYNNN